MLDKDTTKRIFKKAFFTYLTVMIVALLIKIFSPFSFWAYYNTSALWGQFMEFIFPYIFIILGIFSVALAPFSGEFFIDIGELPGSVIPIIVIVIVNLIIYLSIVLIIFIYRSKKVFVKKLKITGNTEVFRKYWFFGLGLLLLGLFFLISSLFYEVLSASHSYPNMSYKEYIICEKEEKIKDSIFVRITNKGVCFRENVCKIVDGVQCNNFKIGDKYDGGLKIVNGLNKDNFDFEIKKNDKYTLLLITINNKTQTHAFGVGRFNATSVLDGSVIKNIDEETFQYLGGKYSKDKNYVYYKGGIIDADPVTFVYKKGGGKTVGRGHDKYGSWIVGKMK
jgi:hypothetical protein